MPVKIVTNFFTERAWKLLWLAYVVGLVIAPSFAVRINLFGIFPANLFMGYCVLLLLAFGVIFLKTGSRGSVKHVLATIPWWLQCAWLLFWLCSSLVIWHYGLTDEQLGQWIVLFFLPLLCFISGVYTYHQVHHTWAFQRTILYSSIALTLLGILCVVQYYTAFLLPELYQGNLTAMRRSLGWFNHPNSLALYVAPLLGLLLPTVLERLKLKSLNKSTILYLLGFTGGLVAVFYSFSRGGWVATALLCALSLFYYATKHIRFVAYALFISLGLLLYTVPLVQDRAVSPFLGEKAAEERPSLWLIANQMVTNNPWKGFGILGFREQWQKYNDAYSIDWNLTPNAYNYPHNIVYDFWVDYGIGGLLAILTVVIFGLTTALHYRNNYIAASAGLALLAMLLSGMVDNPYFKNDLAYQFWFLLIFLTGLSFKGEIFPPQQHAVTKREESVPLINANRIK